MATSFGPLFQLMRNGTIPPAEADEIMYYLQLNAAGKSFAAKFDQRHSQKNSQIEATPVDD